MIVNGIEGYVDNPAVKIGDELAGAAQAGPDYGIPLLCGIVKVFFSFGRIL